MSTTTKNTLLDISSPDRALQAEVFEKLLRLDSLQANPIRTAWQPVQSNNFLYYGQFHHAILKGVDEVCRSTNPIHISDGLLSESFVLTESMGLCHQEKVASNAIRFLKTEVLKLVRILHIHIRVTPPGNVTRRMALNLWRVSCQYENEQWITFNTPDIALIEKEILGHMTHLNQSV